ncbi:hypothetical protein [Brevundimonas sp. LM2]|nr:hypothetical protein [Brevundimonas sp. LM2]
MTADEIEEINARLTARRQGDIVLTDVWSTLPLAHLASPGTA